MTNELRLPAPNDRILEEARLKVALARQYLESLKEFGLTADWLNELEAACDRAEVLPTYEIQTGELKSLTAAKEAALDACVQWGRKLRYRLQLAFAETPSTGMQFPANDWRAAERNESRMISLFPSLLQLARQHGTVLATAGQTEAAIAEGETLLAALKAANETQEQYKYSRTTATNQRRRAFQGLYEGILRINQTGQMVFGRDSAEGNLFRSNWPARRRTTEDPTDEEE
ncbi:MAG: hypothetical protein HC890_04520 [Chloroflexaceae bacterium]|nr:hypothetical protein [Chloroflexaceae bacterium]